MALNMNEVRRHAEFMIGEILKESGVGYKTEYNNEARSLSINIEKSIKICGYDALLRFMFMDNGEVYFFTLFDEVDLTEENAALAFEASTTTPICVTIDDFLTLQLGAYIFSDEHAADIVARYIQDMVYLLEEDDSTKALLAKMH